MNKAWIAFIVVGSTISILLGNEYLESKRSKSWPVVNGVITVSKIRSRAWGKLFGSSSRRTYYVQIQYVYWFDDIKFIGNKVRFGWTELSDRKEAINLTQKYNVGSKVDVFYNPTNPLESVLDKRSNFSLKLNIWTHFILCFLAQEASLLEFSY